MLDLHGFTAGKSSVQLHIYNSNREHVWIAHKKIAPLPARPSPSGEGTDDATGARRHVTLRAAGWLARHGLLRALRHRPLLPLLTARHLARSPAALPAGSARYPTGTLGVDTRLEALLTLLRLFHPTRHLSI